MPEIRKYPTARVIGSLSDAYVTAPNVFFSCRVSGQGTSIWDSLVIRYTAQSQEKAHDAYVSWLTHVCRHFKKESIIIVIIVFS